MCTIDLAYVGRGLHEELVTYIADQQGYYVDEGVHVALRDGCSWDEERLRHGATAIVAVAAELGVPATVTAADFYRTATTKR
ncbi:hypothetical protein [Microbispora rosea]|uniref:hypothetical protein n=1 Tax=Microbispora rosea TaxID=58117 RepID=UPI00342D957C